MIKDLSDQIASTCRFCNPPERDRILFSSDNFYVMLSLGPIVEGYALVVSKEHHGCCAGIPDISIEEFDELLLKTRLILQSVYKTKVVCYEHGRAGSCLSLPGSQHCYHAHMHLVPVYFDMNNQVSQMYKGIEVLGYEEFREVYKDSGGKPYLFVDDETKKIYFTEVEIPRQYLRTVVANHVSAPELWDWVSHQNWLLIESAKATLQPLFSNLVLTNDK